MIANRLMILGAVLAFSANSVYAGPCTTVSRDAGPGNVPGYTGQTTGSTATASKQQPSTSSTSKASENTATSSEDAQRQMQSAAEQSKATRPAPSAQSPDRTAGTVEQTRPAPTEQSKRATAGAAEPAPAQQKVTAAEQLRVSAGDNGFKGSISRAGQTPEIKWSSAPVDWAGADCFCFWPVARRTLAATDDSHMQSPTG